MKETLTLYVKILTTLEAAEAFLMVGFQSCLGQGASSFTLRGEAVSFPVFLCYTEPLGIHHNKISPSAQISFTGVLGVALMLGAALDHARASSLDAGEPGSDFFLALLGG